MIQETKPTFVCDICGKKEIAWSRPGYWHSICLAESGDKLKRYGGSYDVCDICLGSSGFCSDRSERLFKVFKWLFARGNE